MREAFQQGHCSRRAWPVERPGQLETLQAARSANFVNYIARIHSSPQEYIDMRYEELEQFLDQFG
jgi:hypothetical protein